MIYVMSDIHGEYDKYIKMLDLINFSDNDTLYILGDFVDRGNNGIKVLFDVMKRPNIVPLMGNHDWTFANLALHYNEIVKKKCKASAMLLKELWLRDGGRTTFNEFKELNNDNRKKVLEFIETLDYIKEIEVNGKKYFLAHTVPPLDDIPLIDHLAEDFIESRPDYDKRYFENKIIITGHTPTLEIDVNYKGKIWYGNGHIAIDCGAVFGGTLGCLCLDDGKEYYVK